jgi:dTDP-4-amino-4,6-dideoxygalactose transaminase
LPNVLFLSIEAVSLGDFRTMDVIPFVDLRSQYVNLAEEIGAAIQSVLDSCSFILGPEVTAFEAEFAEFCGARFCVGVGSGTAALRIALQALNIGPGDEVVLPANTYIATALAVTQIGAVPVLVDVDKDSYQIDAEQIPRVITPRTRAVIPVHLYGRVAPMDAIREISRRYGLAIIEDAAQAHGAMSSHGRVGILGDVGCFSFYPGKNLGAFGDGGAIVTNREDVAERARLFRDFGQKQKYQHLVRGDNSRLDSLQAAVLRVKLKYLDTWNERRRRAAAAYDAALHELGFRTSSPVEPGEHVYHLYVIEVPDRDGVREFLKAHGIETGIHYPIPIHLQPAFADLHLTQGTFPVTESLAKRVLSLPMFPEISPAQISRVMDTLRAYLEQSEAAD